MSPTLRRYIVMQVPGVVIAGAVAVLLWLGAVVSEWVALAAFVAWLVKDAVLYPFVKSAYETAIPSGAERLVGETGFAATAFDPSGRVRIRGEIWNARLERGGRLESGSRVVVVASDGLTLIVRAAASHSPPRV